MPQLSVEARSRSLSRLALISATSGELTDEILLLADRLSLRHGRISVARESSGLHFYLASPACLEADGKIELEKLHLAVNVEKYFRGNSHCAYCMKTGTPYDVDDLLFMPPLSERGYEDKPEVITASVVNMDYLEPDAAGNLVPKSPGVVIPVPLLPHDHPAREYLRLRRFDADKLYQQFRVSWGEKERNDIHYRRMSGGFHATPQGRLIFFVEMHGITKGWQARILEKEENDVRYYWHPYKKCWTAVLRRTPDHPKGWLPIDERWEGWDPVKYTTCHGARRNECLMGLDAALKYKQETGKDHCLFMEGPLDAARLGPPALSIMGRSLSRDQFALMIQHFNLCFYFPDNDAAGKQGMIKTARLFEEAGISKRLRIVKLEGEKDLGALSDEAAQELVVKHAGVL